MPLARRISFDMPTVMSLATDNPAFSIAAAFATLLLFVGLWYIQPRRDPIQVDAPRS